jgi:hypothetical protein
LAAFLLGIFFGHEDGGSFSEGSPRADDAESITTYPVNAAESLCGQKGHSISIKLKEHQYHILLEHLDNSAVAEHNINLGHNIELHNTHVLGAKSRYMDHVMRDMTE